MKKIITVVLLVCIMASMFTISAFAYSDYSALQAAISSASDGATITLTGPIDAGSSTLVIDNPITLDGAGFTLESDATRAINVNTNGNVTIKNLKIEAKGERAINVIQKPVALTIEKVTASSDNYTVNLAASAVGCNVTIIGGEFTGRNTLNIAAPNSATTVNGNAKFITNDSVDEDYHTVCLNKDSGGASLNLQSATLTYNKNDGKSNTPNTLSYINGTSVNYSGASMNGSVEKVVAFIPRGDYYFSATSLAGAASNPKIKSGDSIVLLQDIDLDYTAVEIPDGVTIDANGHEIINGDVIGKNGQDVTVDNWGGTPEALAALKDGIVPKRPVPVPATADNSNMPLWGALFIAFAAVALLTGKKRRA